MARRKTLLQAFEIVLSACFFGSACWVMYQAFRSVGLASVYRELGAIEPWRLGAGLALTVAFHCLLTGYDFAALRCLGEDRPRTLPAGRVFIASLTAYVFGNNLGMANLGSGAARLRMYRGLGLRPRAVARLVLVIMLANWLGFLLVAGAAFVSCPARLVVRGVPVEAVGWACLGLAALYWALSLPLSRFFPAIPAGPRFIGVTAVAVLDFALSGSVLYVLLPERLGLSYPCFLSIFLLGHLVGTASQIPGDMGVFESVFVLAAPSGSAAPALLSALIVYRAVYFLLPLALAIAPFLHLEVRGKRKGAARR